MHRSRSSGSTNGSRESDSVVVIVRDAGSFTSLTRREIRIFRSGRRSWNILTLLGTSSVATLAYSRVLYLPRKDHPFFSPRKREGENAISKAKTGRTRSHSRVFDSGVSRSRTHDTLASLTSERTSLHPQDPQCQTTTHQSAAQKREYFAREECAASENLHHVGVAIVRAAGCVGCEPGREEKANDGRSILYSTHRHTRCHFPTTASQAAK